MTGSSNFYPPMLSIIHTAHDQDTNSVQSIYPAPTLVSHLETENITGSGGFCGRHPYFENLLSGAPRFGQILIIKRTDIAQKGP